MFNWDSDHQIIDEWNHYSQPGSYKMLFFMFSIKTLWAEHRRPPTRSVWVSRLLWHFDAHSGGVGVKLLYWPNAGTSDALRRGCSTPSSLPPLKKNREDQSLLGALPPRVRHLQGSRTGRRSTRRSAARRRSLDTRGGIRGEERLGPADWQYPED